MDNTIQGQGYIYQLGSFQNQGTVDANVSSGTFYIDGVNTTNTGTLEATAGGTIEIYATAVTNTNQTISADTTSSIILYAATINGGDLAAASPAVIHGVDNTTLNDVTITSGTTYSVDAGNSNYLTGNLVNQGTINVGSSTGGGANLYADLNGGTINLSGGGTINLNNANSFIRGYNGNETLINVDNTIQGQGYIYQLGSFQNQGTVDANVSSGTFYIDGVNTTNTGTLEATAGGTIEIYATAVTNTNQTISADTTSSIILYAATINGGDLAAASPAVIHGVDNTTLNDVTITSGTTYSVDAGNSNYLTGNLVNQGTINVGSSTGGGATSMPISMAAPSTSPAAAPSTSTTPTLSSGAITATRP